MPSEVPEALPELLPKPTWRGRIHLGAFVLSLPAGLALVLRRTRVHKR